jgi:hypothetical protein
MIIKLPRPPGANRNPFAEHRFILVMNLCYPQYKIHCKVPHLLNKFLKQHLLKKVLFVGGHCTNHSIPYTI